MNNQFSQRVSEIISYSKEEANRLRNKYIGPEHLLLGILRDGEGKAIDILTNFHIDLRQLKGKLEGYLTQAQDTTLAPDADCPEDIKDVYPRSTIAEESEGGLRASAAGHLEASHQPCCYCSDGQSGGL